MLCQCLIGFLAALIFGLPGAQFGRLLLAGVYQAVQFIQGAVQRLGVKVAIGLGLMLVQALLALLQQDAGLLDFTA